MEAAMYLRKSRADGDADTETTLQRHRETLTAYAAAAGIHVVETYQEVASGESLYERPQMLRLLQDVEAGHYQAVLCMDMDRLSRGSMRDQGIVLDAFKYSGTLIVTPDKTYDLAVEADEQYAELKTFISRQEYKLIQNRLRRGLKQSISDGCYVANAPYGYRRVTVAGKPTLEIHEPEARFVRMMFQLYADGYGCVSIARQINAMGAKPHRSAEFSRNSVKKILNNPVYIGKIIWNQKSHIKKGHRGNEKHITIYNPKEKWEITNGIHPPIIDTGLWEAVQAISEKRYIPSRRDGTVKSPLAGIVRCENCGGHMQRVTFSKGGSYLICPRPGCCAAAKFEYVENVLITHLSDIMDALIEPLPDSGNAQEAQRAALEAVRSELSAAEKAKARLYELVETGVYSVTEFRERMEAVKGKIVRLQKEESEAARALEAARNADPVKQVAQIQTVLDLYRQQDAAGRNSLLRSVVDTVWYTKKKKTKPADFILRIVLKGL